MALAKQTIPYKIGGNYMQTTDKVQTGESTTGTSTNTSYTYTYNNHPYNAEKGWECPRCHRINAPWMRQCDCNAEWKVMWNDDASDWWKYYVKATQADCVGGSDYFNPNGAFWSNVAKSVSNIKEIY